MIPMTLNTLLSLQAGTEAAWANPATPTVQLMGLDLFDLLPLVESEVQPDLRASPAPGYTAVINKIAARAEFEGQQLYEDQCYWLESLMGIATPTGTGPYTRAYAAPQSDAGVLNPRLLSLYKGDAASAYRLVGGVVSQLTFKGGTVGPQQVIGQVRGQQIQSGAALAALSDRPVTTVLGDHLNLYMDAWTGSIGATLIPASGFAYELTLNTHRHLRHFLNALTPGAWLEALWSGRLQLSLAFNSTTQATLNALLAGTLQQQQIRLAAANGLGCLSQLDFAGTLLHSPRLYDDHTGQSVLSLNYVATFNPNLGNWFRASVTNELIALP